MSDNYLKEIYLFDEIFNNLSECISVLNENEETIFVNLTFLKLTGYTFFDVIGEKNNILSFTKSHYPEKYNQIKRSLYQKKFWEGELWFENREKNFFPILCKFIIVKNKDNYIVEIFNDISELKKHKEYYQYLKYYNEFLDLPNKVLLKEKIESKLKLNEKFSIILITINNLKKVNDIYGRKTGDDFLLIFSKKLKDFLKSFQTKGELSLFYLEGNQFVIVCNIIDKKSISNIVKEIFEKLFTEIFVVNNFEISIEASSGCYIVKEKEDYYSILHKLYIANEVAKNNKKSIVFYIPKFEDEIVTKYKIENLIRKALKFNLFTLHYQPRLNVKTMKIESVEALIRMYTDEGKLIPPGVFIPIAEESYMIIEIGNWVFKKVVEDAIHIISKSGENIKFSFNVSANQFLESDFIDRLKDIFQHSNQLRYKFEIEITEWALMKDIENSIKKMIELKELGFDLIIDDFGTGYSSLSYLKEFPVDFLKIDKSFTDGIPHDIKTVKIVKSIIYLAKQLNLKITAEGVEHTEQFNWFKQEECDEIQGYYFSKPIDIEKLIVLLKIFNKRDAKLTEKYFTRIPAFDAYHTIILNILNYLENVDIIKEDNFIDIYLTMLSDYMETHFKEEERFLILNKISFYRDHIKEHKEFKKEITSIRLLKKYDNKIFSRLKEKFLNHIYKYHKILSI